MSSAVFALFQAPQLFAREWFEVLALGGVLYPFFLYLKKRTLLVYLLSAALFLEGLLLFQLTHLPFLAFCAEVGAALSLLSLTARLLLPPRQDYPTALSDLLFTARSSRFLLIIPQALPVNPYCAPQADPVEKLSEAQNLFQSLNPVILFSPKHRTWQPVQLDPSLTGTTLEQATELSRLVDAHIITSDSLSLVHIFHGQEKRIPSPSQLTALLANLL